MLLPEKFDQLPVVLSIFVVFRWTLSKLRRTVDEAAKHPFSHGLLEMQFVLLHWDWARVWNLCALEFQDWWSFFPLNVHLQGSPGPVRVGCACSGRVRAGPGSGPGSVGSHGNQYKTCLSDLATAPKSKELLQKLVVGAVDEIQKAANE